MKLNTIIKNFKAPMVAMAFTVGAFALSPFSVFAAPAAADYSTGLVTVNADTFVSIDGTKFTPVLGPTYDVSTILPKAGATAKTIYFAPDSTTTKGAATAIVLAQRPAFVAPTLDWDYTTGKLNTAPSTYEFKLPGGAWTQLATATDYSAYAGLSMSCRIKSTGANVAASVEGKYAFPKAGATPSSAFNSANDTLTNTKTTMQYSVNGGTSYVDCTDKTTDISANVPANGSAKLTVKVHTAGSATTKTFASLDATVTVWPRQNTPVSGLIGTGANGVFGVIDYITGKATIVNDAIIYQSTIKKDLSGTDTTSTTAVTVKRGGSYQIQMPLNTSSVSVVASIAASPSYNSSKTATYASRSTTLAAAFARVAAASTGLTFDTATSTTTASLTVAAAQQTTVEYAISNSDTVIPTTWKSFTSDKLVVTKTAQAQYVWYRTKATSSAFASAAENFDVTIKQ